VPANTRGGNGRRFVSALAVCLLVFGLPWRAGSGSAEGEITSLLGEVDRWTGFSGAFAHLHLGTPADDRRVVLAAVLADGTSLGLTRMTEACSVASYRQLVWTAAWHLREETYRRALAIVVNAQQRQPLAAFFGAADVSSSDGQHSPTAGPGEAVGAVNAH
jgi:Tn3 transposase DDE domain